MSVKTKLADGQTVKTDNKEGKIVSHVDGNTFHVTKSGERYEGKGADKKSLGIFEASSSRQILTIESLNAVVEAIPEIDGIGLSEIILVFNQVQREDAINSCNSEIKGSTSSTDPEAKKIRGLAKTIELMFESGDVDTVKNLLTACKKSGKLETVQKVLGDERFAAVMEMAKG